MHSDARAVRLLDREGTCIARLSRKAQETWKPLQPAVREIRLLALVRRNKAQETDHERASHCRVEEWELPVAEVVFAK